SAPRNRILGRGSCQLPGPYQSAVLMYSFMDCTTSKPNAQEISNADDDLPAFLFAPLSVGKGHRHMNELLTPKQMAEADRLAAEGIGDSFPLMLNAGEALASVILARFVEVEGFDILCGPGNN